MSYNILSIEYIAEVNNLLTIMYVCIIMYSVRISNDNIAKSSTQ